MSKLHENWLKNNNHWKDEYIGKDLKLICNDIQYKKECDNRLKNKAIYFLTGVIRI